MRRIERIMKLCRRCFKERDDGDYYLVGKRISNICRGCHIKTSRRWQKLNIERVEVNRKAWEKANKNRRKIYLRQYRIKNKKRRKEILAKWLKTDAGRAFKLNKHYKKKYGIKYSEYERMFGSQNGVCAICRNKEKNGKRLCVDHDHETGKIRGLLCNICNIALGFMEKTMGNIDAFFTYLAKHKK